MPLLFLIISFFFFTVALSLSLYYADYSTNEILYKCHKQAEYLAYGGIEEAVYNISQDKYFSFVNKEDIVDNNNKIIFTCNTPSFNENGDGFYDITSTGIRKYKNQEIKYIINATVYVNYSEENPIIKVQNIFVKK